MKAETPNGAFLVSAYPGEEPWSVSFGLMIKPSLLIIHILQLSSSSGENVLPLRTLWVWPSVCEASALAPLTWRVWSSCTLGCQDSTHPMSSEKAPEETEIVHMARFHKPAAKNNQYHRRPDGTDVSRRVMSGLLCCWDTSHDHQLSVSVSARTLSSLTEKEGDWWSLLTLGTDRSDKSKKSRVHSRARQLCSVVLPHPSPAPVLTARWLFPLR